MMKYPHQNNQPLGATALAADMYVKKIIILKK